MSADKLNEDKFDDMLGRSLRRHIEPVPDNFTARISKQIKEAEQQRILARVGMQERLARGGWIALVGRGKSGFWGGVVGRGGLGLVVALQWRLA